MLPIYLGALAFGGTLLVASLVLGASQKDLDKDLDKDFDKDVHLGDKDKDLGTGGLAFLPVTSLRFWTFLLAFGGATGTALTYAGGMSALVVAAVALVVGWASGVAMVTTMRTLRKGSVGSELSARDLRGETGDVLVGISRGEVGKIRVVAKGRIHDVIAETEDEAPLPSGSKVMIIGEGSQGRVQVTKP